MTACCYCFTKLIKNKYGPHKKFSAMQKHTWVFFIIIWALFLDSCFITARFRLMQNFEFDNDAQTDGRSWDGIDTWNLFDKHQRKNFECIRRYFKTHIYDLLRIRQLSNNFARVLVHIIKSQPSFREPGLVKWRHSVASSDVSSKSNFYRKATTLNVRQDLFWKLNR